MKTIAYLLISCLLAASAFAGTTDVPAAVKGAFAKQFPNAQKVKWEKEKGNFEAEFRQDKKEFSALFDSNGNLLEWEEEIPASEVPKAAMEYAAQHYPGKKIKETARITDAKGDATYEVEVAGKDLIFDANGLFLLEK